MEIFTEQIDPEYRKDLRVRQCLKMSLRLVNGTVKKYKPFVRIWLNLFVRRQTVYVYIYGIKMLITEMTLNKLEQKIVQVPVTQFLFNTIIRLICILCNNTHGTSVLKSYCMLLEAIAFCSA